jgi:hypothetical protein
MRFQGDESRRYPFIFCAFVALGTGCGASSDRAEPPVTTGGAVVNGNVVSPWADGGNTLARAIVFGASSLGECTGTVISPSWVLTAQHCSFAVSNNAQFTSIRPPSFPGNDNPGCPAVGATCITRVVDSVFNDPRSDITLAHLSEPFTDLPQVELSVGSEPAILNQSVDCYGYSGTFTLTSGTFLSASSQSFFGTPTDDPSFFMALTNQQNQIAQHGDSGGPCMIGSRVVGVFSYSDFSTAMAFAAVPNSRDLVIAPTRVQFTVADFNGDGFSDFIATTSAGSTWFFSTATGDFTTATEPDLTIGSVVFTTGDFDADGKADVIVTNAAGSAWWYATDVAGVWDKENVQPDLTFNFVQFTTGDFDNDGRTDFVETTPSGSSWYYATPARGQFAPVFTRSDLPVQLVGFTAADFDGDNRTDLIVTTPLGSQWLYANDNGTWDATPSTNRDDLVLGAVSFTAGDFDGDSRSDVVITTTQGSFWYFATPVQNQWDETLYSRPDLPLGTVKYVTGDFNNDGRKDLVITTGSGSYWYISNGRGSFDDSIFPARGDLPLGSVRYSAGDFNADGQTDLIITVGGGSFWYYSAGTFFTNPRTDSTLPL